MPETKQLVENLTSMGPVGWSVVALLLLVMVWGLKKQYTLENYPGALVFGLGSLILFSLSMFGLAAYLGRSATKEPTGKADTKIRMERKEGR